MSTIPEFFAGKAVLVTGATGFLGKALVEKILRSLPGVRRLYLLIRPKERGSRTLSADERFWGEILKSSVFDRLKQDLGDRFDAHVEQRVAVVNGDLTDERLGVSDDDYRRLTEDIDVIVNSAAVVVFDERLDLSLDLNTFGARRMMDFARDCRKLRAVVHISTCYVSGAAEGWVKEEVAPPPFDVEEEARRLEAECAAIKQRHGDDRRKAKEELVALGLRRARELGWHDTYTFTKWMGEQLTAKYRGGLPTVILRPAIIESTFREPEPGWIDGFRMGDPLFVGYGKGQLKDFPARPDTICDLIPCDHVVNALLACVPRCAAEGGFTVYQVATGELNPVHFRTIYDVGRDYFTRNPMYERDGTRVPTPEWTFPEPAAYRRKLLWQYGVPLRLGATFLRPLSFVRKIDKVRRKLAVKRAGLDLLLYYVAIYSPYSTILSRYATTNTQALWNGLSPEDQRLFDFDARGIDWRDYIANVHIPGLKRNVLNLTVEELEEGSGTPVRTIPDLLARSADRAPEAVALQTKRDGHWVRFSYDELQRHVQEAAARLHTLGVRKGDRVLLYADNQPEWGIAYLAAVSLGAVVVPADRQLRECDVMGMARYIEARAVLTSESAYPAFSEETRRAPGAPLFLNINAGCAPCEEPRSEPAASARDGAPPSLTLRAPTGPLHHSSLVGPDDLASIIFTSGVHSSDPRAVMLTHRNFLANVMGVVQLLPPRPSDNFISVLPLHHALEFTGGFLVPLFAGATVTYCDTLRSRVILDTMRETRATSLLGVPRVFQILHDAIRRQTSGQGRRARLWFDALKVVSRAVRLLTGRNVGRRLFAGVHEQLGGRLRAFISGGAALAPQVFDHFTAMGFELCEGYGLTETAPIATANPLGAAKKGSVGIPLPGVEVQVLHPDERGVGEVAVRGPNVTPGYYRNEAATRRALRDGWLHTGDVGYLDRERYLFLTGRIKDLIVTAAGKNVYPEEVEHLYAGLPHVAQLCVVGVWDDEVMGETIHAVVVPDRDGLHAGPGFEGRLRRAVQDRSRGLPTYQRLQRVHVVAAELPKNDLGVVDRARVRQGLLERLRASGADGVPLPGDNDREPPLPPARNGSAHGPNGAQALEEGMRAIVARVSGVPRARVAMASDLEADLRLDSLSKVELLLALETHFQVPLPESLGPALHTFGDVVEAVRQRVDEDAAVAVAERPEVVPPWGKVLAPKGAVDDGAWLRAGPGKRAVRLLTRQLMRLYAWAWFGFEVRGAERLPAGGFIVAANHCSHLDTGAVVTAFGRRGGELFVMGARDYFFNRRLKGWFFHTFLKVIPFDRTEKVIEGLRLARAVLTSGRPVLIYPEGKRSAGGELQPFKPGIGLLGVELGVPIVPCLVEGTYAALPKGKKWPRRSHIRVTFGPPVTMEGYRARHADMERVELYRRIADDVRGAIVKMRGGEG
jgi:long-chain acyl-CoA synthetase